MINLPTTRGRQMSILHTTRMLTGNSNYKHFTNFRKTYSFGDDYTINRNTDLQLLKNNQQEASRQLAQRLLRPLHIKLKHHTFTSAHTSLFVLSIGQVFRKSCKARHLPGMAGAGRFLGLATGVDPAKSLPYFLKCELPYFLKCDHLCIIRET